MKHIVREHEELISSFIGSFVLSVKKDVYLNNFNEARNVIYKRGVEPRIIDNFRIMYAGCVSFAPEYKEKFIELIAWLMDQQQSDFEENGQSQQIIKILGQYVSESNRFNRNIYFDGNYVILPWDDVLSFINRERKRLELSEDANYDMLVDQ